MYIHIYIWHTCIHQYTHMYIYIWMHMCVLCGTCVWVIILPMSRSLEKSWYNLCKCKAFEHKRPFYNHKPSICIIVPNSPYISEAFHPRGTEMLCMRLSLKRLMYFLENIRVYLHFKCKYTFMFSKKKHRDMAMLLFSGIYPHGWPGSL